MEATVSECRREVTVTDGRFFATVRVMRGRVYCNGTEDLSSVMDPFDALAIAQRDVIEMRANAARRLS